MVSIVQSHVPHAQVETIACRLGYWEFDLETQQLFASRGCRENFGRDGDAPFDYADVLSSIHPDDKPHVAELIARSVETGCDYNADYRIVRPDNSLGRVLVRAHIVRAVNAKPGIMVGISVDITGYDAAEHAICKAAADPLFEGRTQYGAPVSLDALVRATLSTFDCGRFDVSGCPLIVPSRTALALSRILRELLSNARRFGSLSTPDGRVAVEWVVTTGLIGTNFVFEWIESGGPTVAKPERLGLGSELLERSLTSQFGADGVLLFEPDGVRYGLTMSLDCLQASF